MLIFMKKTWSVFLLILCFVSLLTAYNGAKHTFTHTAPVAAQNTSASSKQTNSNSSGMATAITATSRGSTVRTGSTTVGTQKAVIQNAQNDLLNNTDYAVSAAVTYGAAATAQAAETQTKATNQAVEAQRRAVKGDKLTRNS